MRDGQKTRFARRLRKTMTPAEKLLWWRLRRESEGWKFRRQPPVGPFVADFACLEVRLAVEVDGATHSTAEEIDYDARRTRYLERHGWRVVRFWNSEIFQNLDGVIDTIQDAAWEQENWLKQPESPRDSPPTSR
jgi:very-short-patch-repair endonuclease